MYFREISMCLYHTYPLRFIYSVKCSLFGVGSALLYVHHSYKIFSSFSSPLLFSSPSPLLFNSSPPGTTYDSSLCAPVSR